MTKVDTAELVTALKNLKVHLKARRNLDVLVRQGYSSRELVFELSGRSRLSGILTTMGCGGGWRTKALVSAASLRGFVLHPPGESTTYMSFHDGRLHIGTWSCPAREQ